MDSCRDCVWTAYWGAWTLHGALVQRREVVPWGVREEPLDPRLDLVRHSPTGFAWGYGGSGPAQLALALCADALGGRREDVALRVYQEVKRRLVEPLEGSSWMLTRADVLAAVREVMIASGTPVEDVMIRWLEVEIMQERRAKQEAAEIR